MTQSVKSRVALVTGGTGGIGSAICRSLAQAGHKVAATCRNEEKAKAFQAALKAEGLDLHIYKCDVGDFDDAGKTAAAVLNDLGPVQILVNSAGITRDTTFRKMSREQWHEVMVNNLDSVFNITRPLIDPMLESGWGRIVNIGSINGQKGQFGQSNYAATKAGMHGLTMSLAQETARKGVTVNTVAPGYIDTDMIAGVPEKIRESIKTQIPVGRFGTPEDIAGLVSFLVSEGAGFITGAQIAANGGQHME